MTELHQAVARIALQALPHFDGPDQLSDHAMTAWQFGCMALVAMGVAKERRYGCELIVPREDVPTSLNSKGLWIGDAGFVLLALGAQTGDMKATRPAPKSKWTVVPRSDAPPIPSELPDGSSYGEHGENLIKLYEIALKQRQHAQERREILPYVEDDPVFRAHPSVTEPLSRMGWITAGRWTEVAQETLWRSGGAKIPRARLEEASEQASAQLPADIGSAIEAIYAPPPMDAITKNARDWFERTEQRLANMPEAARVNIRGPKTLEEICEVLVRRWPDDAFRALVGQFEARWRWSLGWDRGGGPLIPLFHDRFAHAVAQSVSET